MENGRTEQIIDRLVDMIENGQSVPLSTGKVMVNKDEAILMLRELENIVNGELKVYREVTDRKGKIINEAKKEAEDIIYEAEQTASRIRVTKRMSSIGSAFRADSLSSEEKGALRTATDIYAASLIYTDEMLTEVNDVVAQAYDLICNQYGRMVQSLEEKAKLIADNKAELMESLKELSKEERYTQILDLGQLLSFELYNERARAREMDKNGGYQMELTLETESGDRAGQSDDLQRVKQEVAAAAEEIPAAGAAAQPDGDAARRMSAMQPDGDAAKRVEFAQAESAVEQMAVAQSDDAAMRVESVQQGDAIKTGTASSSEKKDPVAATLAMFKGYRLNGERTIKKSDSLEGDGENNETL